MTNEEKQLLLKDLCTRLSHGVILHNLLKDYDARLIEVNFIENKIGVTSVEEGGFSHHTGLLMGFRKGVKYIQQWLPYLRPTSSMTEEEQKEFVQFHCVTLCPIIMDEMLTLNNESNMFDWLNAHHFDFRNLIGKGLAIDCTNLNIY